MTDKDKKSASANGKSTQSHHATDSPAESLPDISPLSTKEVQRLIQELQASKLDLEAQKRDLQKDQTVLRSILDTIPQAVFWKDRDSTYLGCNQVFADAVGVKTPKDVVGITDFDLPWPREDAEAYRADDAYVISHAAPKRHIIETVQYSDGRRLTVDTSKMPLFDENGTVRGVLGIYEDITDRKRAEDALRESESFIRAVMDNLPLGIAVNKVEPAVDFVYMNENFPKIYRTTREALTSSDAFWNAVYEDTDFREEMRKRVLEDCASDDPNRMYWVDVPITRKGSQTTYITARNTPVPGKQLMISTVWDVTDRKQIEEERLRLEAQLQHAQKLESLGILAGGITHDFNNLMGGLFGYIETAQRALEKNSGAMAASSLDKAMNALDRARDLSQQLLTFSKGGAPAKKLTDMSELVREAAAIAFSGSNIRAHFNVPDDLWSCAVDRNQLIQAIDNVLINAKDAMPEGGIVSITARNVPDRDPLPDLLAPGRHVQISIKDPGVAE